MNVRSILPAILAVTTLCGCAQFSESYFLEEGFSFDLRPYLEQRKSSYEDGILEVYEISPDDELYKKIFNDNSGMHSEETLFIQDDRQYFASHYVMIEDWRDGFVKFVLYMPKEKTMVFMYATGFGA